jgi:hypothetical protein
MAQARSSGRKEKEIHFFAIHFFAKSFGRTTAPESGKKMDGKNIKD